MGVYTSGATAYRSANRLGSMTADYLSTQVDALLEQYDQILEDAAYMVNAMVENGSTANEIENWITAFSQEYNETMQYRRKRPIWNRPRRGRFQQWMEPRRKL